MRAAVRDYAYEAGSNPLDNTTLFGCQINAYSDAIYNVALDISPATSWNSYSTRTFSVRCPASDSACRYHFQVVVRMENGLTLRADGSTYRATVAADNLKAEER
jgi:hypothetical protein